MIEALRIAKELNWSESFTGKQCALVTQGITDSRVHDAVIHLAQLTKDEMARRENSTFNFR